MQFTVIIERGATSCGAYIPNLTGCIADGLSAPEPVSTPEVVEIAV